MKIEKFKVLLYLKKSGLDKKGKAPIMGRITLNNSMAQFNWSQPGRSSAPSSSIRASATVGLIVLWVVS